MQVASCKLRIFIYSKEYSRTFRAYEVEFDSNFSKKELKISSEILAEKLLVDAVCEKFEIVSNGISFRTCNNFVVWFKDGVYDAQGEMAFFGAQKLGLASGVKKIKFGRGHIQSRSAKFGDRNLFNPLVEVLEKL